MKTKWIHKSDIEWTDYGMNIYRGCPHRCTYCYAAFRNRKPVESRIDPVELPDLYKEAMSLPAGRLMLCTATDPYPYHHDIGTWLTAEVLQTLLKTHHHILILTKGYDYRYDLPLFINYKDHLELGITLTTLNDAQAARYEPYAAPPSRRIIGLKEAHEAGVKTYVSLEPWIPYITAPMAIICELDKWVDRWIIGRLNHRKVPEGYYKKELPPLIKWLDEQHINYYLKKELKEEMAP